MFLEIIHAEGLGHLSYIIGDGGKAAVIDPRRDCKIYTEIAKQHGAEISYIFETHRNEDYVSGALELARRSGATILHGEGLPFEYGEFAKDGNTFPLGKLLLTVLATPGHTYESISVVVADTSFSNNPVGIFTGDALFVGDVGRTDFFPGKEEEVAGLLYDSLFNKILPLGNEVIIYPAHGAGSVCGAGLAAREFSTIGYERKHNRILQMKDRDKFIAYKAAEHHYKAPYFKMMEKYNLEGIPLVNKLPEPKPVSADEFDKRLQKGLLAIDIRSPEAFAGAHIPGSINIPFDMVAAFAGWIISYDDKVGLIVENIEQVEKAMPSFMRLGFDNVTCYLRDGAHAWEVSGKDFTSIPIIHINELQKRIKKEEKFTLLDVRAKHEAEVFSLPNSQHIYVGELSSRLQEIDKDKPITTLCASGRRAMIAASILKKHGLKVDTSLGALSAGKALGCFNQSCNQAA